jgi:multidrug resistance protein MdtO
MATLAQTVPASPRPWAWFGEFLKEELTPYPGRAGTVARMVIAATLVMIIGMTFRIPDAWQGAIYALLVSRESPRATLQSAATLFLVTGIGAAYLVFSMRLFINLPSLHFLWVIATLFLGFYAISALTNYLAAVAFINTISAGIPLWDRHVSAETNVEDTLWLCLAVLIAVAVTAGVELAFVRMSAGDDIVLPIAVRLNSVEELLNCYLTNRAVDSKIAANVTSLAMRGASRLRRNLRRSSYSPLYREQMGALLALVGRLVDIAANLTPLSFSVTEEDRLRIRRLAENIAGIRADLLGVKIPSLAHSYGESEVLTAVPLLPEMERTVSLIAEVFEGGQSLSAYAPSKSRDEPPSRFFLPYALSNPEHLKFALKGCLAASLCYILYNSLAWPGISTAVTTCLLTALSTIGSSRQKQVLRFTGAIVGGFVLAMGSQIFILPYVDSIAGFTVLFIFVTGVASWIMTSSARLSYFGVQVALAFYLVNLQEFKMQTSLEVARDRVLGILLGLVMMWLVFDQLWSASAGVEMKRTFISILRLLAQLAREPRSTDRKAAIERTYSLRETMNDTFDKVRTLADGVLFEFGPSRQQDLALRDRIRRWQPQLRLLFVARIALLKYRLQLPGFELPKAVAVAQQEFDEQSASTLDGMADRLEGKAPKIQAGLEESRDRLEQTVRSYASDEREQAPAGQLQTLISLSRTMVRLIGFFDREWST